MGVVCLAMPTDDGKTDPPPDPPTPPDPPAGPSKDEVKGWVREALAEVLAGGGKPPEAPDLSTDKKIEAYVEEQTRKALEVIRAEEAAAGKTPPSDEPDPDPDPETLPETKTTWQQKAARFLWGEPAQ